MIRRFSNSRHINSAAFYSVRVVLFFLVKGSAYSKKFL